MTPSVPAKIYTVQQGPLAALVGVELQSLSFKLLISFFKNDAQVRNHAEKGSFEAPDTPPAPYAVGPGGAHSHRGVAVGCGLRVLRAWVPSRTDRAGTVLCVWRSPQVTFARACPAFRAPDANN